MLSIPVANWTSRSNPRPKPACGTGSEKKKSKFVMGHHEGGKKGINYL